MAVIRTNALIKEIRGKVGDLVASPHPHGDDQFILKKPPARSAPFTDGELRSQTDFRASFRYAQGIWAAHPDFKAAYQVLARIVRRDAFHLAMSDFRRHPKVLDIDLSGYTGRAGERIQVWATDDCEVIQMPMRVLDLSGTVLEEGMAVLTGGAPDAWSYLAQRDVPAGQTVVVEVAAVDRPGNRTVKRVDHACGTRGG